MKILFLGVSPALAVGNHVFQSNMMIESERGRFLLIDCGTDIKHSLYAQNYSYADIDGVYISHLHSDHIGGLEWLGFCKYFMEKKRSKLYISEDQRETLWNNALSAGMSTLEEEQATLSTFFDVQPIINNQFTWEGYTFQLIKTLHTISNKNVLPSYGLLISTGVKKIFISTDARLTFDDLAPIYHEANIIFHDCETYLKASGQHARYNELKKLDKKVKNKMWLYDYYEGEKPDAVKDGFLGYVKTGQCFNFECKPNLKKKR